jgi:peptidyl-prolyl cis-trans isomerase SurA
MKHILLALVLVMAAFPASAQETRIAAVVNDDVISLADLASRMRLVMASSNIQNTPENEQRVRPQVIRILIDEKLELQEAKRLNITVSDDEISATLARIAAQNNVPKDGLDKFLQAHGLDHASLVDQITPVIAWGKVVRENLSQLAAVSDEEIDAALARLKETAGEPRARIAEIFLAVDTPQQDEEVHHFADRLYEQLRNGSSFAAVAQQFSQSATAAVGGDIGWVTPSELNTEIGRAAAHLQPNQIAPPIRAAGGWYLVMVIERQAGGAAGGDDTKVSISQIMFPLAPTASAADRQRVTAQAESVASQAKSCGEFTQLGHQMAPQTSGDLGQVRVGDLPAELRPTVLALKVAEASHPVPLRGGIGVLMVCDREAGPSALPSRDDVADKLTRDRFENLARRYLRDLRRAAFVEQRV